MGNPIVSGGDGSNGKVSVRGKDGTPLAELVASDGEGVIGAGNKDRPGRLTMFNGAGKITANLTAASATLVLGENAVNGKVSVRGKDGAPLVELVASDTEATIGAGNEGRPGLLNMYGGDAEWTVSLAAEDARLELGGGGREGKVSLLGTDGALLAELGVSNDEAVVDIGNLDRPARLKMFSKEGALTADLTAEDATLALGGNARNGRVSLFGADGTVLAEVVTSDTESALGLGNAGRPGAVRIFDGAGSLAIELNGEQGDIFIANADCAEEFDLGSPEAEPGMVMVLAEDGAVVPSTSAYDTRVVGVASGAGSFRPGLVLDRRETGLKRIPVALMGKVFCLVDATEAPVRVGDLLTTSGRKGHAMRATDRQSSFGAVLGKALAPVSSGRGLIPVLVCLR